MIRKVEALARPSQKAILPDKRRRTAYMDVKGTRRQGSPTRHVAHILKLDLDSIRIREVLSLGLKGR